MENENKESKSNGMELLENVIKSNKENIDQNIKLHFAIEDHTTLLNDLKISLEDGQSINNETVVFFKLVQAKITELITSIPTQTEMVLSKETKDYLDGFRKDVRWKKKFICSGIGIFVFAVLDNKLEVKSFSSVVQFKGNSPLAFLSDRYKTYF